MRIILYTGKGGVGKTSIAAATALKSAALGHRTLVVSTDAAHSLADSLDLELGPKPLSIGENLWAQEIDTLHEAEQSWTKIQSWLTAMMSWQNLRDVTVDELMIFPGMEELFSLLQILRHHDRGNYDVLIVDCAPTGETLRLLSYPSVFRWWMDRIFPIQKRAMKVVRPVARVVTGGLPMPSDDVMQAMEDLFREIHRMHSILTDPDKSSVRLVVNPEKMVIKEARRSFTYLNLFGFNTDAVVVNRLLPGRINDEYFSNWKEIQEKYDQAVEESFSPLPIFRVPLFDQEVVGPERLMAMAERCFGTTDPTAVLHRGSPQTITRENGEYVLTINLPFTSKGQISLSQKGEELTIRVGEAKRNYLLPRTLAARPCLGAKFVDETLRIRFGAEIASAEQQSNEQHSSDGVGGETK